jgi:hypothetical protein
MVLPRTVCEEGGKCITGDFSPDKFDACAVFGKAIAIQVLLRLLPSAIRARS